MLRYTASQCAEPAQQNVLWKVPVFLSRMFEDISIRFDHFYLWKEKWDSLVNKVPLHLQCQHWWTEPGSQATPLPQRSSASVARDWAAGTTTSSCRVSWAPNHSARWSGCGRPKTKTCSVYWMRRDHRKQNSTSHVHFLQTDSSHDSIWNQTRPAVSSQAAPNWSSLCFCFSSHSVVSVFFLQQIVSSFPSLAWVVLSPLWFSPLLRRSLSSDCSGRTRDSSPRFLCPSSLAVKTGDYSWTKEDKQNGKTKFVFLWTRERRSCPSHFVRKRPFPRCYFVLRIFAKSLISKKTLWFPTSDDICILNLHHLNNSCVLFSVLMYFGHSLQLVFTAQLGALRRATQNAIEAR